MKGLFPKFKSKSYKVIEIEPGYKMVEVDPKSVALWDQGYRCPVCGDAEHFNWSGDESAEDEYFIIWGYNGNCDLHGMTGYEQNFQLEDFCRTTSRNKKTVTLDPTAVRTYYQKGNRCPSCDTSAFSEYLSDDNIITDKEYTLGYTCRCGNCGSIFGYADRSYLEDMIRHPASKLELVSLIKKRKKQRLFGFLRSKNEIAETILVDPTKIKIYWEGTQCFYCGDDIPDAEDTSMAFPSDPFGWFGGSGATRLSYNGDCHGCKGFVDYREFELPEDVMQIPIKSDNYDAMTEIIYTAWRMGKISDEQFDKYSDELYAAHKEWCDQVLHRKRRKE